MTTKVSNGDGFIRKGGPLRRWIGSQLSPLITRLCNVWTMIVIQSLAVVAIAALGPCLQDLLDALPRADTVAAIDLHRLRHDADTCLSNGHLDSSLARRVRLLTYPATAAGPYEYCQMALTYSKLAMENSDLWCGCSMLECCDSCVTRHEWSTDMCDSCSALVLSSLHRLLRMSGAKDLVERIGRFDSMCTRTDCMDVVRGALELAALDSEAAGSSQREEVVVNLLESAESCTDGDHAETRRVYLDSGFVELSAQVMDKGELQTVVDLLKGFLSGHLVHDSALAIILRKIDATTLTDSSIDSLYGLFWDDSLMGIGQHLSNAALDLSVKDSVMPNCATRFAVRLTELADSLWLRSLEPDGRVLQLLDWAYGFDPHLPATDFRRAMLSLSGADVGESGADFAFAESKTDRSSSTAFEHRAMGFRHFTNDEYEDAIGSFDNAILLGELEPEAVLGKAWSTLRLAKQYLVSLDYCEARELDESGRTLIDESSALAGHNQTQDNETERHGFLWLRSAVWGDTLKTRSDDVSDLTCDIIKAIEAARELVDGSTRVSIQAALDTLLGFKEATKDATPYVQAFYNYNLGATYRTLSERLPLGEDSTELRQSAIDAYMRSCNEWPVDDQSSGAWGPAFDSLKCKTYSALTVLYHRVQDTANCCDSYDGFQNSSCSDSTLQSDTMQALLSNICGQEN